MRADQHVHSDFSFDSRTPMEAQVQRGIELGLDLMCFTEHVDYGVYRDRDDPLPTKIMDGRPCYNVDYPRYFDRLDELRERYKGRIDLRAGLEFGVQRHTVPQYNTLFERYRDRLDFVLLSVHQVNDLELYPPELQANRLQEEYNRLYFEELLAVARAFDHYSVLAHLDVMRRYDPAGEWPFEKNRDLIAEILRTAIERGRGIELNTGSWRYRLRDIQPCREIWRLYRDLGGEIVTLGSDGHRPERVAGNFAEATSILRDELGFRYFCTFKAMEPTFHKL